MTAVIGHVGTSRTKALSAPASRTLRFLPLALILLDLTAIAGAGGTASYFDNGMPMFDPGATESLTGTSSGSLVALGWIVVIALGGGYRRQVLGGGSDEYKRVLNASLAYTGLLALILFISQADVSRAFFMLLFAVGLPGLVLADGVRATCSTGRATAATSAYPSDRRLPGVRRRRARRARPHPLARLPGDRRGDAAGRRQPHRRWRAGRRLRPRTSRARLC